jgi:hypothetical protein
MLGYARLAQREKGAGARGAAAAVEAKEADKSSLYHTAMLSGAVQEYRGVTDHNMCRTIRILYYI